MRLVAEQSVQTQASLVQSVKLLDARSEELKASVRELSEMVRSLNQRLEAAEAALRRTQEEIGGLSRPAAPPPVVAPAVPIRSPAESYAVALTLFQSGEYGQAVLDFMDLVAAHPGHMLAPHAQFWIGEAYYIDRDCHHALAEYEVLLRRWPRSPRVPDALLRIGQCQARLGAPAAARVTWQRLVRAHPRSAAAVQARGLLGAAVR